MYLNPNQVLGASKSERFCKFFIINVCHKSIRTHSSNNESNPYSGADLRVTDSQAEFTSFWQFSTINLGNAIQSSALKLLLRWTKWAFKWLFVFSGCDLMVDKRHLGSHAKYIMISTGMDFCTSGSTFVQPAVHRDTSHYRLLQAACWPQAVWVRLQVWMWHLSILCVLLFADVVALVL